MKTKGIDCEILYQEMIKINQFKIAKMMIKIRQNINSEKWIRSENDALEVSDEAKKTGKTITKGVSTQNVKEMRIVFPRQTLLKVNLAW